MKERVTYFYTTVMIFKANIRKYIYFVKIFHLHQQHLCARVLAACRPNRGLTPKVQILTVSPVTNSTVERSHGFWCSVTTLLHCATVNKCIALHCTTFHCIALHCIVLHWIALRGWLQPIFSPALITLMATLGRQMATPNL